jgi:hypothetical protein
MKTYTLRFYAPKTRNEIFKACVDENGNIKVEIDSREFIVHIRAIIKGGREEHYISTNDYSKWLKDPINEPPVKTVYFEKNDPINNLKKFIQMKTDANGIHPIYRLFDSNDCIIADSEYFTDENMKMLFCQWISLGKVLFINRFIHSYNYITNTYNDTDINEPFIIPIESFSSETMQSTAVFERSQVIPNYNVFQKTVKNIYQ